MIAFDFVLITQLFALINPLSSFPILMTAYYKKITIGGKINIKRIALSAVFVAFIVAMVIAFVGPLLFNFFGITIDSFRIAGGIVLLLLGIQTIRPKKDEDNHKTSGTLDDYISIIATPMLTGPATISFITIKAIEVGKVTLISSIIIAFILVGIVFYLFASVISKVNSKVVDIVSRIMGLFLTAIAVEMISKGVEGLIVSFKL